MQQSPNATHHVDMARTLPKPMCRLDEIMVEQKRKGENYADWQKRRYPVKATRPYSLNDFSRVKESNYGRY